MTGIAIVSLAAVLPPPIRAKLMLLLLGIVIVGLLMIIMVMLGGWVLRRRVRQRSGPSAPLDDAWYKRPLESAPTPPSGDASRDDS